MGIAQPKLRHVLPTNPQQVQLTFTSSNTLLHTANGRIQHTDPHHGRTRTLAFEATRSIASISHTNNLILTTDNASRAALHLLPSGRVIARISLGFRVRTSVISPCGKFAVFAGDHVEVWQLPSSRVPSFGSWRRKAQYAINSSAVEWSHDSRRLAVASDSDVTVFTISERQPGVHVKPLVIYGHREPVRVIRFVGRNGMVTVSRDGAMFCWRLRYNDERPDYKPVKYAYANDVRNPKRHLFAVPLSAKLGSRHFVKRAMARTVTSASVREGKLVVGMCNGVFAIFELPEHMTDESQEFDDGLFALGNKKRKKSELDASVDEGPEESEEQLKEGEKRIPFTELKLLHTLSVSSGSINRVVFNSRGDWVALASSTGQILIWDWQAETHILKQQAHVLMATSVAFSPDGRAVATGSKDGRVKLWGVATGFCAATFSDHSASVTSLTFAANDVIISASLDGTVRAFDIRRYRNFRVMVGPPPRRQFGCVAADAAGELIAAGCVDTFEILVWSLRTGQVLEILNGHRGPVSGISFRPGRGTLASSSWDRNVRLWDMYERKGTCEVLEHSKEVMDVTFRPDGKELAVCTTSGEIVLWDPERASITGTIDGARDSAPGRLRGSRTAAPRKGRFQTLSYSADGRFLFAGAASKNVCVYHVAEGNRPTLVNKIAATNNQDFDGLLDKLNSKNLTVSGHVMNTVEDDNEQGEDYEEARIADGRSLPGAVSEQKLRRKKLLKAEVNCVRTCATGRLWAAVTPEGVLVYGEDEGEEADELLFDPTNLEVDITPDAAKKAADEGDFVTALSLALRLNERAILNYVVERVPVELIGEVSRAVSVLYFNRLVLLFAWRLDNTPHLEFNLRWAKELILAHGGSVHRSVPDPSTVNSSLRSLNRACRAHSRRLVPLSNKNEHMLEYLLTLSRQATS
ncbi:WD40-repeat containing protein [Gracilaria domingensis]|nr:WD40-repeat containing protein [Gracilaria domingensis]